MVKVQKRVSYGMNVLEYYTTNEWFFENDFYKSLKTRISKQDNEVFYTDFSVNEFNIKYIHKLFVIIAKPILTKYRIL